MSEIKTVNFLSAEILEAGIFSELFNLSRAVFLSLPITKKITKFAMLSLCGVNEILFSGGFGAFDIGTT